MAETSVKANLKKQIAMLEKVQKDALDKGDMQKVQEIAASIVSISNMISSLK